MDLLNFFLWWLTIFIVGLVFLPISGLVFNRFYDKGYLFSKTLGIAIASYIMWLLASMKILAFSRPAVFTILGACFGIIIFFVMKYNIIKKLEINKACIKIFLWQEFAFISLLAYWSYIRGMNPKIEGLEKFMDVGFVNTILRSTYFPPKDMWLANEPINYYYFGHYVTAFLTKLSDIDSAVSYNLMMATLFAFSFVLVMSFTLNLLKNYFKKSNTLVILGSLISGFLIAFGGNLHIIVFGFILPYLKYKMGISFPEKLEIRESYWFPDATRYIGHNPPAEDFTIHEFPNYSFVVSDLHAHVINIMFVITILAVLFSIIISASHTDNNEKKYTIGVPPLRFYLIPFFIGIFQMTNYWDFPIYVTVSLFAFVYLAYLRHKSIKYAILESGIFTILNVLISLIVAFFFNHNFQKIASEIKFTPTHTAIYQFLIVWGYQLFFSITFMVFLLLAIKAHIKHKQKPETNISKPLPRGKKVLKQETYSENKNLITPSDIFCLILCISAIGLLLVPEVIYVKDIYDKPYHRSNTVFKLTYQSYIMFGIVAGYVSIRLFKFSMSKIPLVIFGILVPIFIVAPLVYPYYSISDWYGTDRTVNDKVVKDVLNPDNYKGLDGGMNFIHTSKPDAEHDYPALLHDMYAVNWLNKNELGQPNIVEAPGESYTLYSRFSAFTGLPTVIGWRVHEWLWRNSSDIPGNKMQEVDDFYASNTIDDVNQFIAKYDIKYIVIGALERKKYTDKLNEELLSSAGSVLEFGTTKLIQIK